MSRKTRRPAGPEVETDPRFPSGKWTGFWLQRCYVERQWMSLNLTFIEGQVRGEGSDCVGDFEMRGSYDVRNGQCTIVKSYHGAHSVSYEGRNEGDGMWIWGLWSIRASDRGGFHLWPAGEEDPTGRKLRAARGEPKRTRVRLTPVGAEQPALAEPSSGPTIPGARASGRGH